MYGELPKKDSEESFEADIPCVVDQCIGFNYYYGDLQPGKYRFVLPIYRLHAGISVVPISELLIVHLFADFDIE